MKILMVAPEPFFRVRGTPFSIRQRLGAVSDLAHTVDLITYPFGQNVEIKGLKIFRSFRPFWIKDIKIGPSLNKIPLDFFLFLKTFHFIFKNRYDCIHTHEEAGFLGALVKKIFRLPHVYDMHSSLPEQLVNYKFIHSPVILRLARITERWLLKNSSAVIAICPHLAEEAGKITGKGKVFLIENLAILESDEKAPEKQGALKKIKDNGNKIVLYTGTFEYNQGLDLLLEAAVIVKRSYPAVKFVLAGGDEEKIKEMRKLAKKLNLEEEAIFIGKRPMGEMPALMSLADILVSPRRIGNNTPLKIYSYLFSGRPIVATHIYSHTQVLNKDISMLTDLSPEGIAQGILKLLEDEALGEGLAQRAKKYAGERFSREQYLAKVKKLYQKVEEEK